MYSCAGGENGCCVIRKGLNCVCEIKHCEQGSTSHFFFVFYSVLCCNLVFFIFFYAQNFYGKIAAQEKLAAGAKFKPQH